MRFWITEPGEYCVQHTGELGGLWRRKGCPPQQTAGVGFAAQGFDISSDYLRLPASADGRAAFIFEGVEEAVGDRFGAEGLAGGGAAGLEIDRAGERGVSISDAVHSD